MCADRSVLESHLASNDRASAIAEFAYIFATLHNGGSNQSSLSTSASIVTVSVPCLLPSSPAPPLTNIATSAKKLVLCFHRQDIGDKG